MTDQILSADALREITNEARGPERQVVVNALATVLAVRAARRARLGETNAGLTRSEEARLDNVSHKMLVEVFESKGFTVHGDDNHPGRPKSFWISW